MGDQSQVQSVDEQGDRTLPTVVQYSWADNHQNRILNLLKTGAGSDLTLLVGPEKTHIKVHSLILMAGSQKFQNRLDIQADSERVLPPFKSTVQELRLEDEDPEIFALFLEELYTGNCNAEKTQALPLLKIATDYGVKDLLNKCAKILRGGLNCENVITIFSQAMECFNKELIESSIKYICKNASAILSAEDFANLRLECLVEILKQDDLKLKDEMEVFAATYRWGEAECKRQKLDLYNPKDMRKVLNKALAYIRFPNMKQSEFALNVATKSILDEGELMSLMICFMVPPSERPKLSAGRFMSTPRAYTDTRFTGLEGPKLYLSRLAEANQRFFSQIPTYRAKPGCFTETLLFSVSQAAKFCGIKIAKKMFCFYDTAYPKQFEYKFDNISLTIVLSKALTSAGYVLAKKTKAFDYEVCVDVAINLEAKQLYKIDLSYSGPIEYKQIQIVSTLQKQNYDLENRHSYHHKPAPSTHPISFTPLQDFTVKASASYPLHAETGYQTSKTFTARNSVGELETIKVDFSRESGDTKMTINEGFIEKLIFQME